MEKKSYITKNARQTQNLGRKFTETLAPGDSVLLAGELGSGKTTFIQGVARGLNVKTRIISPSFVLVRKHKGKLGGSRINLYHIDLYRIDSPEQIRELGLDEIFQDEKSVVFIEWGQKASKAKFSKRITFEILGETSRKITFLKERKYE